MLRIETSSTGAWKYGQFKRFFRQLRVIVPGLVLAVLFHGLPARAAAQEPPPGSRMQTVLDRTTPRLQQELTGKGFRFGAHLFIRILKLPGQLEVWLLRGDRYQLFKSYPICNYSGFLGPKIREGDWQSPEGFYKVTRERMNPYSSYHLAFNIGYPNAYDQAMDRSGGNIMVHGDCSSMGCFAMSDHRIEEIYTLAHAALEGGQHSFAVHIFPFAMTAANMRKFSSSPWFEFWANLREGYEAFERTGRIPEIHVQDGRYVIGDPAGVKLALSSPDQAINSP